MKENVQEPIIVFRPVKAEDRTIMTDMIQSLYRHLGTDESYMTIKKIESTFEHLFTAQNNLKMDVFEYKNVIVGYALLFDFWSNEYGGKVLQLDELYLIPEFRSKGIATSYIERLSENKTYVALLLEVLPQNEKAYKLYKQMGFNERETKVLIKNNFY